MATKRLSRTVSLPSKRTHSNQPVATCHVWILLTLSGGFIRIMGEEWLPEAKNMALGCVAGETHLERPLICAKNLWPADSTLLTIQGHSMRHKGKSPLHTDLNAFGLAQAGKARWLPKKSRPQIVRFTDSRNC